MKRVALVAAGPATSSIAATDVLIQAWHDREGGRNDDAHNLKV